MKNIKVLIIIGGVLILLGVLLKLIHVSGPWPALCFGVGGTLKLTYMVVGVRSGQVKVGAEIALLIVGLSMVLLSVYIRHVNNLAYLSVWFLSVGVLIKALFVVLFIKRQRKVVSS